MILKGFNLEKIDFSQYKIILLYGENLGYKEEILKKIIGKQKNVSRYEEKDILKDKDIFLNLYLHSPFLMKKKKSLLIILLIKY